MKKRQSDVFACRLVYVPGQMMHVRYALPLLLVAAPATAFDRLVVFGDSLSDVGNVEAVTSAIPFVPTTPGPFYSDGRFTNGDNYVDVLSDGLGLGPVSNSFNGGDIYAYGGALATGTGLPTSLVVQDIDDQVDLFLTGNPVADADTLFVVFAGGNDISSTLSSGGDSSDVEAAANVLIGEIERLYDAGGRSFLTPNLPPIGLTPRFNANPAAANALSVDFNYALDAGLDQLESTRPDLVTYRLDVFDLFTGLALDPASAGFVNVTDEAAPGLSPGDSTYDTSLIAANVDEFVFWDDFHPTTAAHALLGQTALALVPEPSLAATAGLVAGVLLRRRR